MQKSARTAFLVIISLFASLALCVASAFAAALAFGAVALIVPGTGTHNVTTDTQYRENAADRYISASGLPCTSTNGCDLLGVDYPASFWPIPLPGWCPGLRCDTWNESVEEGVTQLGNELTAVVRTAPADEQIIIFGYSQGGAVVSRAMYDIPEEQRDRISVVTIGNINNPQGLWSRLSFLRYIPILNVSFGPQLPTDIGVKSTNYSFEYDPVGDAPRYWGNPLAVLNALFAFEYVHGYYLDPNANAPTDVMPYGYDNESLAAAIAAAPKRVHGDATFVLIPQRGTLPLFQPFVDLGNATGTSAFVDPVVRLLQPVTKLLVDLGYDRNADPGVPRNLSILPFNPLTFNPIQFSADFVEALVQGIEDAFRGSSMIAVPVPAPAESEPDDEPAESNTFRLAADEHEAAQLTQEPTTSTEPLPEGKDTSEELEETPAKDATVTPLPTIDSQEPADLDADQGDASDKEAVKEEDVEQDGIAGDGAGNTEEDDSHDEATDNTVDDSAQQNDADPPQGDDGDADEGPKADGADPADERAAA
ncbi:PE-PPE domain-containing protein [Mycolicibacterium litorale]|uniref:PE-PPE domain-containing protein n=1 Tax=Mycolicibacterium litorale TaxID=758802 RepID=UPI003CF72E80